MNNQNLTTNSNGERDLFKIVMGILQTIIAGGLMWMATTQVNLLQTVARLEAQLEERRESIQDRYTASQAAADRRTQAALDATQTRDIGRHQAQIVSILERLRVLERDAGGDTTRRFSP